MGMIRQLFFPGLLDTGPVHDRILAIRDGFVNMYVVKGAAGIVCIDTGWRPARVTCGFAALGLDMRDVSAIFLTHAHWDHARCLRLYPNAQVYLGDHEDPSTLSKWQNPAHPLATLRDGQTVTMAGLTIQAVHTPGHTIGSVSYIVEERFLFVGDTLRLRRGEAFPFHAVFNCDGEAIVRSSRKLACIDAIECLLTAHSGVTSDLASAFRRWSGPVHLQKDHA